MHDEDRSELEAKWEAEISESDAGEIVAEGDAEGDAGDEPALAHDAVAAKDADIEQLTDQLLRLRAEMVNYRRRVERDQAENARATKATLVGYLLPVIDDFERAVDADGGSFDTYREGVELILKSLRDVLKAYGLARLAPRGLPFDPALHEAAEQAETDAVPEGHVAEVFKVGYQLDGRLVRPAVVSVACAPPEATPSED